VKVRLGGNPLVPTTKLKALHVGAGWAVFPVPAGFPDKTTSAKRTSVDPVDHHQDSGLTGIESISAKTLWEILDPEADIIEALCFNLGEKMRMVEKLIQVREVELQALLRRLKVIDDIDGGLVRVSNLRQHDGPTRSRSIHGKVIQFRHGSQRKGEEDREEDRDKQY